MKPPTEQEKANLIKSRDILKPLVMEIMCFNAKLGESNPFWSTPDGLKFRVLSLEFNKQLFTICELLGEKEELIKHLTPIDGKTLQPIPLR